MTDILSALGITTADKDRDEEGYKKILEPFDEQYKSKNKSSRQNARIALPDDTYVFDIVEVGWEKREAKDHQPTVALRWHYRVVNPELLEGKVFENVVIVGDKTITHIHKDFQTLYVPGSTLVEYFEALPFLAGTRVSATLKTNERNHYQAMYLNRVITLSSTMREFLENNHQARKAETNPL